MKKNQLPPAKWREVKALYERGDSLRSISERIGVPFKTIDHRAKRERWEKNGLSQLITDTVSVGKAFRTLDSAQKKIVKESAVEVLDKMEWLVQSNMKVAGLLMKKIATDQEAVTYQDLSAASSTLGRTKDNIFGKGPEVAVQINNSPSFDVGKLSSAALAEIMAAKDAGKE